MKKLPIRIGFWIMLIGWLLFALGPYAWMLLTSLKPADQLFESPIRFLPEKWTISAYKELLTRTPFLIFMKNSIYVGGFTLLFTLILALPAGYSLSRHDYRNKKVISATLLSTQFFPTILLVLALYPVINNLGLMNSLTGLIVINTAFVTPFTIFLIKGFFDSIPKELDEAAMVDGSSELGIIFRILLPAVTPGIIAAACYVIIFSWNEFLFALTFTANSSNSTLPVGLNTFIGDYVTRWDLITAGGFFSAIPMLIFFLIIQKRLIEGLTAGAIK